MASKSIKAARAQRDLAGPQDVTGRIQSAVHVLTAAVAGTHERTKMAVALLLTFVAGCVDIIGYLSLYHTFTAHMTGDTVHLGENLFRAHGKEAAVAGSVIAAFVLGSIAGRALIEIGARRRIRRVASLNLLIEAALIAGVVGLSGRVHPLPILALDMLAAAMGLQTATLTRVGSLTIHTTFVTGMLNKLAQLLSHAAFVGYDRLRGRTVSPEHDKLLPRAGFIFSIWLLYLVGAVVGTWVRSQAGIRALWVPAALVTAALAVDQVFPLSVEEEHDQPER